jgi:hypothetical protein
MDDTASIVFMIAIAVLYYCFFRKLIYYVLDNKETSPNSQCTSKSSDEYNACYVKYDKLRDQNESKIFIAFIIIGVIGLIGSTYSPSANISGGIASGSLLLLFEAVLMNWMNFNEGVRLGIMGISLGALLYASHKIYNNQSVMSL